MTVTSWFRTATTALLIVIAAAAIVLVFFALQDNLGYDSAWHVFIARQTSWANFWHEVNEGEHPPLFYLALIGAMKLFGKSLLAYRLVSISAALVSTWLVGRITARLTASGWLGVLAAAAFGLSWTAIDISLEVRPYSLAIALMLVAFNAYLAWISGPAEAKVTNRIVFASAASAAILTSYSTFFFVAATVVVPMILALVDRAWAKRLVDEMRTKPLSLTLMLLTPPAVAAVAYQFHAARWSISLGHLKAYLYSSGRESLISFLTRTTRHFFALSVPTFGFDRMPVIVIGVLFVALCIIAVRTLRSRPGLVPFIFVAVMVPLNVLVAVVGRYPFGGELRHEFFFFPFLVICLFTALESVCRRLRAPWSSPPLWRVAAGLLVIASSVAAVSSFYRSSIDRRPLFPIHVQKFRAAAGVPAAVLVDQFSLIIFLVHYDDWDWRRTSENWWQGMWQVWDLRANGSDVKLCRSKQWQLDLSRAKTYQELTECFKQTGASAVAVFRPQQPGPAPEWLRRDAHSLTSEFARSAGLCATRLVIDEYGAFGTFRRAPDPYKCTGY
jgi:hypothetical protein